MSFRKDALMSELRILLEKEREMKNLYNEILNKLENPTLHGKIMRIKDDEVRHIGYVDILISLFESEEPDRTSSAS